MSDDFLTIDEQFQFNQYDKIGETNGFTIDKESSKLVQDLNSESDKLAEADFGTLNNTANKNSSEIITADQRITINIREKKQREYLFCKTKGFDADSYYTDIQEFHGYVESINSDEGSFFSFLKEVTTSIIVNVKFGFDDLQFDSEKSLIAVGVPLIWLIGQEVQIVRRDKFIKPGTRRNFSQLMVRRSTGITKRQAEIAKEEANEWGKFFQQFKIED